MNQVNYQETCFYWSKLKHKNLPLFNTTHIIDININQFLMNRVNHG